MAAPREFPLYREGEIKFNYSYDGFEQQPAFRFSIRDNGAA